MKYPAPDVKGFLRRQSIILVILVCFHWAPDAYAWFSSNVLGRGVVIDARRYEFILLVAYIVCGTGVATEFAGIVWALIKKKRRRAQ